MSPPGHIPVYSQSIGGHILSLSPSDTSEPFLLSAFAEVLRVHIFLSLPIRAYSPRLVPSSFPFFYTYFVIWIRVCCFAQLEPPLYPVKLSFFVLSSKQDLQAGAKIAPPAIYFQEKLVKPDPCD